jgi:hypothetical protein
MMDPFLSIDSLRNGAAMVGPISSLQLIPELMQVLQVVVTPNLQR